MKQLKVINFYSPLIHKRCVVVDGVAVVDVIVAAVATGLKSLYSKLTLEVFRV